MKMPRLAFGMFGVTNDGSKFAVCGDRLVFQDGTFSYRDSYDENGRCSSKDYIVELFNCRCFNECVDRHSIWKRSEKKTYTYEQLKEILGDEFEIVKE